MTREELVTTRDARIEQIQGDWHFVRGMKAIFHRAVHVGLSFVFIVIATTAVSFIFMFVLEQMKSSVVPQTRLSSVEIFGYIAMSAGGIFLVVTVVVVCILLVHARYTPVVVNDSELVWIRGKGHVPQRVDLRRLESVHWVSGGSYSRLLRLLNLEHFDIVRILGAPMLASKGEHNTPRIAPFLLARGPELVEVLTEIADINSQIGAIDAAATSTQEDQD